MESFGGKCARILLPEKELEMRHHIGSELDSFAVPARALQLVRHLTLGLDGHGRIRAMMTNRPLQRRLAGLEGRIGIEIQAFSGTTDRPGDPTAQRREGLAVGLVRRIHFASVCGTRPALTGGSHAGQFGGPTKQHSFPSTSDITYTVPSS
jgi:hypothetical protein